MCMRLSIVGNSLLVLATVGLGCKEQDASNSSDEAEGAATASLNIGKLIAERLAPRLS